MPNSYSRRNRSNNSTLALLSKPPLAPAPQVEGRLVTPGGVGQHSPAHGGHHSIAKPGLWVLGSTAWHAYAGTLPQAEVMGVVGLLALVANGGVGLMLYRYRAGDANMRSVWICSRNDAIGNLAVLLAAAGVFGTGTGWPDIIVATIMAALGISGGLQILAHAWSELRSIPAAVPAE